MRDDLLLGTEERTGQPILSTGELRTLAPLFTIFEELTLNTDGEPLLRTYAALPLLGTLCIQYAPRLDSNNLRVERRDTQEQLLYLTISPLDVETRPTLISRVTTAITQELQRRYAA